MSVEQMMSQLNGSLKADAESSLDSTSAGSGPLGSWLEGSTGVEPPPAQKASGQNPQNRIFVTKIPADLKENDVKIYFEGFGKLCDFYMPASRDGVHKGMAFLSFADAVDKELSLQNAPHVIGGYEVHCEDAKPKNDSRPTYNYYDWGDSMWDGGAGAPGGGGAAPWALAGPKGSGGWGGGGGAPAEKGGAFAGKSFTTTAMNERGNRVFVTRVAEELTKEDLEAYFTQFGELTDIFVPLRNPNAEPQDGMHKGIAFVSFKDRETYEEVLSRDKYEIKPDVFIVVDKAAGKEPRKGKGGKGDKGGGGGGWGKGWGKKGSWDDWGWDSWGGGGGSWDSWGKGSWGDDYKGGKGGKGGRWGPY